MILFSDPADVAAEGTEPDKVYPNTFWLPPTGMQRGSLILTDGDPQTPNYPSIEGVHRVDEKTVKETVLPKIPCQPVSFEELKSKQTVLLHYRCQPLAISTVFPSHQIL